MLIEPVRASDLKIIPKLQPEGWPDIASYYEFYRKSSFCYPVKATCRGDLAGLGAAISYVQTGWLGHIFVGEKYRNQGIGRAVADHLCRYLINTGHMSVSLIATDLGFPVYSKCGFMEETEYVLLEREIPANRLHHPENLSRIKNKHKAAIYNMDRIASGEDRRNLLEKYLKNGYIYQNDAYPSGFYLRELGEGLIIADDPAAGVELMKLRILTFNKAVLPAKNHIGIEFYSDQGFTVKRRVKRMFYGKPIVWHPHKVYSRAGGNFG